MSAEDFATPEHHPEGEDRESAFKIHPQSLQEKKLSLDRRTFLMGGIAALAGVTAFPRAVRAALSSPKIESTQETVILKGGDISPEEQERLGKLMERRHTAFVQNVVDPAYQRVEKEYAQRFNGEQLPLNTGFETSIVADLGDRKECLFRIRYRVDGLKIKVPRKSLTTLSYAALDGEPEGENERQKWVGKLAEAFFEAIELQRSLSPLEIDGDTAQLTDMGVTVNTERFSINIPTQGQGTPIEIDTDIRRIHIKQFQACDASELSRPFLQINFGDSKKEYLRIWKDQDGKTQFAALEPDKAFHTIVSYSTEMNKSRIPLC